MKTVSIITPTYNSRRTIEVFLNSLNIQDYPHHLFEHIVADGGSTDGTLEVLNRYSVQIIHDKSGSPEKAKANALKIARNELVLFLASDNILPHSHWLTKLVDRLEKTPAAIAAYPAYYQWRISDTILTRYFALFGANDPVAWFLGKADRLSYFQAKKKSKFGLVSFSPSNMPTLGDNGFLIKRNYLCQARIDPGHFYHIDVCFDLVKLGFNKFLLIDDTIIHDSGDSFLNFIKKRYRYMSQLSLKEMSRRRYLVFDSKKEKFRLFLYCLYTATLIGPIYHSLKGFLIKSDIAWFIHPLMCIGILMAYGIAIIDNKFFRQLQSNKL